MIRLYFTVLFLTALGLLLFISQVNLPKTIRIDLQFTRVTLALGAVVGFCGFIMQISSANNALAYNLRWWGIVTEMIFGITIDVTGLFLYQVSL